MKVIFFSSFLVIWSVSYGQVTNSVEVEKKLEQAPSVSQPEQIREQELKKSDEKPSAGYRSKTSRPDQDKNLAPAEENQQKSVQSLSSSFSSTKKSSATQRTRRSPSPEQQQSMDETVDQLAVYAPESFEYHFYTYLAGNYNVDLLASLKKAEKIKPNDSEVKVQLAAAYYILSESEKSTDYITQLAKSGKIKRCGISYAKDVLNSVPKNGVLVTHGFDDTYSVLYQQFVNHFRKDVKLVALDFLQSSAYRSSLRKSGLQIPEASVIDVNYLVKFCRSNSSRQLNLSLTTPKEYFLPIKSELYVTGLVFQYSETSPDHFSENVRLWEEVFNKESISNPADETAKKLNANYLAMLYHLRAGYLKAGNQSKVKELDLWMEKIASQSGKTEQVNKLKKNQ